MSCVTSFVIFSLSFFSASGSNLVCALDDEIVLAGGSNFFYEDVFLAGCIGATGFLGTSFCLEVFYTDSTEPCEAVSGTFSSSSSSPSILMFEKADSPVAPPPPSFLSSFSRYSTCSDFVVKSN